MVENMTILQSWIFFERIQAVWTDFMARYGNHWLPQIFQALMVWDSIYQLILPQKKPLLFASLLFEMATSFLFVTWQYDNGMKRYILYTYEAGLI